MFSHSRQARWGSCWVMVSGAGPNYGFVATVALYPLIAPFAEFSPLSTAATILVLLGSRWISRRANGPRAWSSGSPGGDRTR
jgi:hypothetical protein